jgi:hypothetical protein
MFVGGVSVHLDASDRAPLAGDVVPWLLGEAMQAQVTRWKIDRWKCTLHRYMSVWRDDRNRSAGIRAKNGTSKEEFERS